MKINTKKTTNIMNKLFKYSLALLTMAVAFTACSDSDDNYQPGSASGSQVFFNNTLQSQYEITGDANSFTVPIQRANTSGTITVPLTVTMSEGSIFTVPSSVTFNDGEAVAYLTITYDPADIVYGKYDEITLSIADASQATAYGLSTYTFKAGITAWVKMEGKAQYREDLVSTWYGIGHPVYEVEIERNIVEAGKYRLVNPYGDAFAKAIGESDWEDYYDYKNNYYIEFDVSDPDFVWVSYGGAGVTMDSYGAFYFRSYVDYYLGNGYDLDFVKANAADLFGKFVDGVLTMPAQAMLIKEEADSGWSYGNTNGLFAIALPGYAIADYSVDVEYGGIFTNAANEAFAVVNVTLGDDATDVKGVVISADADDDAVADAIASGDLEAVSIKAGSNQIPMPEDLTGDLKVVIVVLKGDAPKGVASVQFEYYGGGANPWQSLGTGYLTDDFVYSYFIDEDEQPKTFEVEIMMNTENPGVYRMKQPYAEIAAEWNEVYGEGDGKKDVDINATDPDAVYILNQGLGLQYSSYGEISIESRAGYWVSVNGFAVVKEEHPEFFGKLANNEITFPSFETTDDDGNPYTYQGYINLPNGAGWNVGGNGAMKLVLPTASAAARAKAKKDAQATGFALRMKAFKVKPAKLNKKAGVKGFTSKKNIKAKKVVLR